MLSAEERACLEGLVEKALAEDLGNGDLTSLAVVGEGAAGTGRFLAKAEGILAGTPAAEAVFRGVDAALDFRAQAEEGSRVRPGQTLAEVSGAAQSVLAGERTALNFLGHLSGVATWTRRFVDAVEGTNAEIFDTRKTLPAFRLLDKYAVRIGGGRNHRRGLWDQVLIKENHLAAGACSPGEAVRRARDSTPKGTVIEVEIESLEQFSDALAARPDVIMLDDMAEEEIRRALEIRGGARAPAIEVSGGVTLISVRAIADLGVDRISVGALTHSAPSLDISMDFIVSRRAR